MIRPAAALIGILFVLGAARAEPVPAGLAGADILDALHGTPLTEEAFLDQVRSADILLLGEVHDNPGHHAVQAAILRHRLEHTDRPASVVFEMLPRSKQPAIDAYGGDADGFADAMGWNDSGWPDAAIYQPVFDAAFAAGARLIAGDLPRDTLKSLYGAGPEILPPDILTVYRSFDPLPEAVRDEMTELQFDAHCGVFPRDRLSAMVTIQRARDAALAAAVIAAFEQSGGPVILIAGTGHTRTDHGAGKLLRLGLPGADILAIGMVERGKRAGAPAPYDVAIATEPHSRPDPCDKLRKSHGGDQSG